MTTAQHQITVPATGTYVIDPQMSEITFVTKHLFGAGTVRGTFSSLTGTVVVGDAPERSRVSASAASESFATGDPRRDAKVKGPKFLHVASHPHLTFESSAVVQEGGVWRIEGMLTARGGTAPLHLTVRSVEPTPEGFTFAANGSVDRYAHGITAGRGLAARMLQIAVTARAVRS